MKVLVWVAHSELQLVEPEEAMYLERKVLPGL